MHAVALQHTLDEGGRVIRNTDKVLQRSCVHTVALKHTLDEGCDLQHRNKSYSVLVVLVCKLLHCSTRLTREVTCNTDKALQRSCVHTVALKHTLDGGG